MKKNLKAQSQTKATSNRRPSPRTAAKLKHVRPSMRASIRVKRQSSQEGKAEVQKEVTSVSGKSLSFRERFAVWRMGASAKQAAKQHSRRGNVELLNASLATLKKLETTTQAGAFAKWEASPLTKKLMSNLSKAAKKAYRRGDVSAAEQSILFGLQLKPGSKADLRFGKQVIKDAFSTAKHYMKQGNGKLTLEVLSMARMVAVEVGLPFNGAKADKLIKNAFEKAVPKLLNNAQQAHTRGAKAEAAALLAEVSQIQRSGKITMTTNARETHSRLTRLITVEN